MLLRENSKLESIFEYVPGFYFNPSDEYADIVLHYNESETWDISNAMNARVVDGLLMPIDPGHAVVESQAIPLSHLETVAGSKITWQGVDVTLEASFDLGVTWVPLINGSTVPNITNGANVSNIAIIFRETITGYLKSLDFVVYGTSTVFSADNPAATIVTSGSLKVSNGPVNLASGNNNGITLDGTHATVKLPFEESQVNGIEFWVKQIADVPGATIVDVAGVTGAAVNNGVVIGAYWSAAYVNAQQVSTISLSPGVWTQITLIASTPIGSSIIVDNNNSFNNGGRVHLGPVLVHQEVPTFAEIKYRYDYAYNQHKVRINGELLTLTDNGTRVYDLDWTIIQDTGY